MTKLLTTLAALALALAVANPALAAGKKSGFGEQTDTTVILTDEETQGRSGKPAQENDNQGTATDTTTTVIVVEEKGPRGVLKNENTDNPNYDSTTTTTSTTEETDKPGRN